MEHLLLLGQLNGSSEERTFLSSQEQQILLSHEAAIAYILREVECRGVQAVGVEPSPMYRFPSMNPEYHSQQYNSNEFQGGVVVADALVRRMQSKGQTAVSTWLMIDNVSNSNGSENIETFEGMLAEIHKALGGNISIFQHNNPERSVLESEMKAVAKKNSADGAFQLKKLKGTVKQYMGLRDDIYLPRSLLVVMHPFVFWEQQRIMLRSLLGEMKEDEMFRDTPREQRRAVIEQLYRHIWIGSEGEAALITKPVFENSDFVFVPIDFNTFI